VLAFKSQRSNLYLVFKYLIFRYFLHAFMHGPLPTGIEQAAHGLLQQRSKREENW